MTDTHLPRGSHVRLGTLEGNLRTEPNCQIDVDGRLVVPGEVRFEGHTDVGGDLECRSFRSEDGTVRVRGDLTVAEDVRGDDATLEIGGSLKARDVDVDRGLRVAGPIHGESFEVGGILDGGSTLDGTNVSVGGKFRLAGKLTARDVEAGGSIDVADVDLDSLEAGGLVRIRGGSVRKSIDVGGRFVAEGTIEYGSLDAGGLAELRGGGKGGSIDVGGFFKVHGDLAFTSLEVGGVGSITGNGRGDKVEVGGKFDVGGGLSLTGEIVVGGFLSVADELSADHLDLGGRVTARRAILRTRATIGGGVDTQEGMKSPRIVLRRKSRASGPLVGGVVELEEKARADDIYGDSVELRDKAVARRIFAATVRIHEGAAASEVYFTQSAEVSPGTTVASPPKKVDQLPSFPL